MAVCEILRKFAAIINRYYCMSTIQIKDKSFTTFLPEEKILKEVTRVAKEISRDMEGKKTFVLKCFKWFLYVYC